MAKDRILFAGGDPNLLKYVGNDPVNFVDPDGRQITFSFGPSKVNPLEEVPNFHPAAAEESGLNRERLEWGFRDNDAYLRRLSFFETCLSTKSEARELRRGKAWCATEEETFWEDVNCTDWAAKVDSFIGIPGRVGLIP
jgi:hypothetical protein